MSRYPWILTRPVPPVRRTPVKYPQDGVPWDDDPCGRCGYAPFGWHKRCPACLTRRPDLTEADYL